MDARPSRRSPPARPLRGRRAASPGRRSRPLGLGDTEHLPQKLRAAPGARVHPEVEGTEIDAGWQRVSPQCVPVERAVDRCRGLSGHVLHINGAKRRVVIPVPQGGQGDAHVGRAPGVGRIIDVAALLDQCEGEASIKLVSTVFSEKGPPRYLGPKWEISKTSWPEPFRKASLADHHPAFAVDLLHEPEHRHQVRSTLKPGGRFGAFSALCGLQSGHGRPRPCIRRAPLACQDVFRRPNGCLGKARRSWRYTGMRGEPDQPRERRMRRATLAR